MNFSTSEDKKGLWPPKVGQRVKALTPAGSDYLLGVVKKLRYHSRWSSFWNQSFEDLKYITLIGTDQRSHTYAVSNVFSVKRSEIPIKIRRAYIPAMQKLPLETYYPQDTYETFGFRRK